MSPIRTPAVAGTFYSDQPATLKSQVENYLDSAEPIPGAAPKALIVPHAGHIYSGPIAASAYAQLRCIGGQIKRVVLIGPAHRTFCKGVVTSSATAFATPLGDVTIDREAIQRLIDAGLVSIDDNAHAEEHSLEVQLPFLQCVLSEFELLPLVVGDASFEQINQLLETVWGGEETVVIISSDLSHYNEYEAAQVMDKRTSNAIEALDPDSIDFEDACGRTGIGGLLLAAKARSMTVQCIDLRNSGDTAGPSNRVVGYGAYLFS